MNFVDFKNGPARGVFAGLGEDWAALLEQVDSFECLRRGIAYHNDRDIGRFVKAFAGGIT
jgi:hypothetical protein